MGNILVNGGKTEAGSGFGLVSTGFRNLHPFVDSRPCLGTCLTSMAVEANICIACQVGFERGRF